MNKTHMIIMEIARERDRQIKVEGYSAARDDEYRNHQLPAAAASFIAYARGLQMLATSTWPWPAKTWKPKAERDSLVKAAALLIAEIERRDREAEKTARSV